MRNVIVTLLLMLCVSVAHGGHYDVDSVELSSSMDLTLKNFDIDGTLLDVLLGRYVNPSDPSGFYWRLSSATQAPATKTVHTQTFTYLNAEPLTRHQLDIYYTDSSSDSKVIMFVPGGAWRQGDKNSYHELGNTLAGFYGFTVVVVNYRLSSDEGGNAVHPDHIKDVAAAFSWIKKNISQYGDPNQLYLFGQSAGAHLVSLLATDKKWLNAVGYQLSDIKGVVSMSGVYDLPDLVAYPSNPLGLTAEEVLMFKALTQAAFGGWSDDKLVDPSPQTHINANQPPFLVIYTYNDISGFKPEAENFVKAVRALNPAPEISLRALEFSDYTDEVWEIAKTQAATEPALSAFVGHWAEVVAINTSEPRGYIPRLVVEFFQSH